mmetsp:Transcript_27783/g.93390  ORF Transcript_27783/g.93390 Transcript_27783/m.93390 type:complete len:219 (-) Transcript_27783:1618-2274(-)
MQDARRLCDCDPVAAGVGAPRGDGDWGRAADGAARGQRNSHCFSRSRRRFSLKRRGQGVGLALHAAEARSRALRRLGGAAEMCFSGHRGGHRRGHGVLRRLGGRRRRRGVGGAVAIGVRLCAHVAAGQGEDLQSLAEEGGHARVNVRRRRQRRRRPEAGRRRPRSVGRLRRREHNFDGGLRRFSDQARGGRFGRQKGVAGGHPQRAGRSALGDALFLC